MGKINRPPLFELTFMKDFSTILFHPTHTSDKSHIRANHTGMKEISTEEFLSVEWFHHCLCVCLCLCISAQSTERNDPFALPVSYWPA